MTDWKIRFDETFDSAKGWDMGNIQDPEQIKSFITSLLEKVINEIPDVLGPTHTEEERMKSYQTAYHLKQQLKDKYL